MSHPLGRASIRLDLDDRWREVLQPRERHDARAGRDAVRAAQGDRHRHAEPAAEPGRCEAVREGKMSVNEVEADGPPGDGGRPPDRLGSGQAVKDAVADGWIAPSSDGSMHCITPAGVAEG